MMISLRFKFQHSPPMQRQPSTVLFDYGHAERSNPVLASAYSK